MNWYYVDGPERVGPIADAEWQELVNTGKIQPSTLVWCKGMKGWTPYSQAIVPPPMEPEPATDSNTPIEAGKTNEAIGESVSASPKMPNRLQSKSKTATTQ